MNLDIESDQLCNLTKFVADDVQKAVDDLPDLPVGVDKDELIKDVTDAVTGVTCQSSPQEVADAIAKALLEVLGDLPVATLRNLCADSPANELCKSLLDPAALKAPRVPKVPNVPNVGGGGGTGGGLNLPGVNRAQLGKDYQEPQAIDPFGLAAHGLDTGLGTMLLQGVAEVR